MIDGIPKGTGNCYLMKGKALPESYTEFKAAVEAGTLPIDLNFNSPGWQIIGTLLSKANLLSDATAQALGLTGESTVNDALGSCAASLNTLSNTMLFTRLYTMNFSGKATVPYMTYNDAIYTNNKFFAVGTGKGATSADGVTWEERAELSGYQIVYGNGVFVKIESDGLYKLKYSVDGVTWTDAVSPSATWNTLIFGGGVFVAFGGGVHAYSLDGINWTKTSTSISAKTGAYGNGRFVVAVSNSSTGYYSNDGITWKSCNLSTSAEWYDMAYGNGRFVLVGIYGAVTSTDGVSWVSTGLSSSKWVSVAYGGGKFSVIATDKTNASYYSFNGTEWIYAALPYAQDWKLVAYGANRFVALAYNAQGAYSNQDAAYNKIVVTDVKGNVLGMVTLS